MGSHASHHVDCSAHIEFAESDAHHGGRPPQPGECPQDAERIPATSAYYRIPRTSKGKQLICVAGYSWSPQYDRVKAIVDALAHEFPEKYEAWFFETNYMYSCIPWHCRELGRDAPELFDRLPLCWIQREDGTNKIIGGRNRLASWVLKTERNSKAAFEAVFLEISDGLRHASPTLASRNAENQKDSDAKDSAPLQEESEEDEEEKSDEHKDVATDAKEDPASAMPAIYKKMLALISLPSQPSIKPVAPPVEDEDDEDDILHDDDSAAEAKKPKPAPIALTASSDALKSSASASSSASSSPRETAKPPTSAPREESEEEEDSDFQLPRRSSEDTLDDEAARSEKPLSAKEQRKIAREKRRALKAAKKSQVAVKTTAEMIRECEERLRKEYPELDAHKESQSHHH